MKSQQKSGLIRFLTVIKLFFGIFWSFYSLKYKVLWHDEDWKKNQKEKLYISQAIHFRVTAVNLGGLLIKLGQFFSTRVDIFPSSTIDELALLQDQVKEEPFFKLRHLAEAELGQPLEVVFAEVDEIPIAAASLGQVHKVVLKDGRIAALKIQRPDIDKLVRIDLKAIRRVLYFIKKWTDWERYIDLDTIYQEFADTVQDELNYLQEGKNAETIKANSSGDPDLVIPEIYWEYSTKRVLTMEYVEGIKINNLETMKTAGIDPAYTAQRLLQIYIKQILIDGFYHADPHPGNLFVREDNKIILVDFGMVGIIPPVLRDTLLEMVFALVARDFEKVVDFLKEIGFINQRGNEKIIIRALSIFLEQFLGKNQDLSRTDLVQLLDDIEKLLYENPFQIPANFTFLGRALGTLYGICMKLNPNISFIDEAKPFLENIAPKSKSIWKIIKDKALAVSQAMLEVPQAAERVLNKADRGDLVFQINLLEMQEHLQANTKAMRSLSYVVGFAFSFIGGIYLMVHNFAHPSHFSFALAALFFLFYIKSIFSRSKKKIPRHYHPSDLPNSHNRNLH